METVTTERRNYLTLALVTTMAGLACTAIGVAGARLTDDANEKLIAGCTSAQESYSQCMQEVTDDAADGSVLFAMGLAGGLASLIVTGAAGRRAVMAAEEE